MKSILLPCRCHKVRSDGIVFTNLIQCSRKGVRGIVTEKTNHFRRMQGTVGIRGYVQVALHGRSVRLNRLIAENFIPNPLALPEAQHKNGNKNDNRACNLKWGLQKENAEDRDKHGNTVRGEAFSQSKLKESDVRIIRALRPMRTLLSLAEQFGVSKKLILLVVQNKIWRHVK